MSPTVDLQFSQASLQDYVDCARRFHLRYVRRLRWPAPESQPALESERHLLKGVAFHRLIRQHLAGIPVEVLSKIVADPEVRRWWHAYLGSELADQPVRRYSEVSLSTSLANRRLVARYDLIAVDADQSVVIVDWKTNHRRPRRADLAERLQTRVYPYVLVRAGDALDLGTPLAPDRVRMVYWFANFPEAPVRFGYDGDRFRVDERYLHDLIEEIDEKLSARGRGDLLPRTEEEERCRFCRYRSLCERGVAAGGLDGPETPAPFDESFDLSFGFEQIAERDVA